MPTANRSLLTLVAALSIVGTPVVAAAERIEQVIVTATRAPEDAQRLPLTWTAVDEATIDFVSPVHINEIMQRVPGAWISRGNGQESLIALRSPVLTGTGSCGAFLTAGDGISLRAPGFCNVNQLFDTNFEQAGRIEVLRGPATALYGSDAMFGVINVLSAAPTTTGETGDGHDIAVEAGPDDYYRGKYRYLGTHGRHGLSLSVNGETDGGYQDDSGYDQQKATLRHDYSGDVWSVRSVAEGANLNQETAGFIEGYQSYQDSDLRKSNPNPEAYRDAHSWRFYSAASRELADGMTLELTPFLRDNHMEFLQHFLAWQPVEENGHHSLGFRATLRGGQGWLRWVSGADIEYTDGMLKETQAEDFSANMPAGVHYSYRVDARTAAVYTQLRSEFDSPWEIDGGLRFESTDYAYHNRIGDGPACGPDADNCRFYRPADSDESFGDWSVNAGVSYELSPALLPYLRLARGFRAPQTAELYRLQSGQVSAQLDSERLDNVELGLRGAWRDTFGQTLNYALAAYYMEADDVIFQDANRFNVSGASTEHYGLELSLDWRFATHWSAGLTGNLARHQYASRSQLQGVSGDVKGNDIDTAPHSFGSARLARTLDDLTGRASRAELEWVYMDDYYLEPENLHRYDGHSLLNLRLAGDLARDWSASLRVTNLLDEDYAERADFGFGEYRYFVGRERGAYVEVSYRFGS